MFKSHQINTNHKVLRKNEVDTYGAPVFAPDYSPIVSVAKTCTNSDEHSMYIRFLWKDPHKKQCFKAVFRLNRYIRGFLIRRKIRPLLVSTSLNLFPPSMVK